MLWVRKGVELSAHPTHPASRTANAAWSHTVGTNCAAPPKVSFEFLLRGIVPGKLFKFRLKGFNDITLRLISKTKPSTHLFRPELADLG